MATDEEIEDTVREHFSNGDVFAVSAVCNVMAVPVDASDTARVLDNMYRSGELARSAQFECLDVSGDPSGGAVVVYRSRG